MSVGRRDFREFVLVGSILTDGFADLAVGVFFELEAGDMFGVALSAGDFNHDGTADLAVGTPSEDIGAISGAGTVSVLYGTGSGLAASGNQQFWQGASGLAGIAEASDVFSSGLIGSDQEANSTYRSRTLPARDRNRKLVDTSLPRH